MPELTNEFVASLSYELYKKIFKKEGLAWNELDENTKDHLTLHTKILSEYVSRNQVINQMQKINCDILSELKLNE